MICYSLLTMYDSRFIMVDFFLIIFNYFPPIRLRSSPSPAFGFFALLFGSALIVLIVFWIRDKLHEDDQG